MNSIFVLALIVAVISRIVTQESIFAELQAWAKRKQSHSLFAIRKLTYPLQCQFCFSVWVSFALSIYLFFNTPLDLVWLSMQDTALIIIPASTFVLTGLANLYLIAYEFATVQVVRTRQGNKHRALNLEWKQIEFGDWQEWRDNHRRAQAERGFLRKLENGAYGYPWNENKQSAQNEGLEQ